MQTSCTSTWNGLIAANGIQIKNSEVDVAVSGIGISATKDITMENSTVSAVATKGDAIVTSGGKVTITKTTVTAKGGEDGISAKGDITISNGVGNAIVAEGKQFGIFTNGNVKVAGGTLTAKSISNSSAINAAKFDVEAAQEVTAADKYTDELGEFDKTKLERPLISGSSTLVP